ncbi:MAG: tRNA (uridine(54)-C5)-methyltransferase TrmA [Verrucomicrobiota bacterium]
MNHDAQSYAEQLNKKIEQTREEFAEFGVEAIEVFTSEPEHYRMRAEFRVWHEGEDLYYIMFNPETKDKYRVDTFPAASQLINDLMPQVIEGVKYNPILRKKLFQVDFLTTLSGEALVSLLYHKPIDEDWVAAAQQLKASLFEKGLLVNLIGRARKKKFVLDHDYVIERLSVNGRTFTYQQHENAFTQPNAKVAEQMLDWVQNTTKGAEGDLLELYCGNGNFSIALARNFRRVLATELSKQSVTAAQWNIRKNRVENLKIARLSAEELTEALEGQRVFRRLQQQDIDLADYDFSTVLVDPPRAGIDETSLATLQVYPNILYISCNPETLKANLETLSKTHRITRTALFDQFPYTHHREMGVVLELR